MTAFEAAAAGALTVIGGQCIAASVIAHVVRRDALSLMQACARMLRLLARSAGFDSVLVAHEGELVVVSFTAVERAIETRDLMSRPVLVHSPESRVDGHA